MVQDKVWNNLFQGAKNYKSKNNLHEQRINQPKSMIDYVDKRVDDDVLQ